MILVIKKFPNGGLWLLTAGGLSYSLGVIFYIWKSMPYNHAIWHLFVFTGTILQFLSVLLYVIPVFR
ncbi:hemolysin III family protein [Parasutterella secunda]|uniref:hemolysin III family protein n=1 Tax=Parasutterella secunda TaxID=626947 RepID=UPI0030B88700